MFRVRYANWSTSSSNTITFVPENLLSNINVDSLLINSTDYNFKPTSINYSFKSTTVDGLYDADWRSITPGKFYNFSDDLETSIKSSSSARRRRIVAGNNYSLQVQAVLSTTDENIAPALDIERIGAVATEYMINDAGISISDISFTNLGRHSNAANIIVTFSSPDRTDGVTANAYVVALVNSTAYVANTMSGYTGNVSILIIDNPGSGYYRAPTITFAETGSTDNATAIIAGENGTSGGNCKAKYVTKVITLADGFDAGDIRFFMDCNRPVGTDIVVYYKVKSGEDTDSFENKTWQLMSKMNDIFSKDQNQIIELEFRPSLDVNRISYVENGTTYPLGGKFKYYAIKIVMTSKNASVVPYVKNYRAIATPAG